MKIIKYFSLLCLLSLGYSNISIGLLDDITKSTGYSDNSINLPDVTGLPDDFAESAEYPIAYSDLSDDVPESTDRAMGDVTELDERIHQRAQSIINP